MEARKVLVKEGDIAIATCPFCRQTKKLSVAHYKEERKRDLRIKCSCREIFCLCLEYRRHPRKKVKLLGKSINLSNHRENQDIIIKNISMGGIGFCYFRKHRTQVDNLLEVAFDLNDRPHTPIETRAMVRGVNKDYVGCEFNGIEGFKTRLGFYLLS